MERVLLSWNIPNWITIVLMGATAYLVLGALYQLVIAGRVGASRSASADDGS